MVPNSLLGPWASNERTSKYWEALCPPHFGFHRLPHNLSLRFVFGFCKSACQNKTNGSHPAHPAVGSCKMHRPHCELESSCPVCFGSCKLQHLLLDGRIEPDKTRQSKRKGDMVFYPFLLKADRGPTVSYGTFRPWLLTTIPSQKMILQARCPSAIRQGLHHAEMEAKPVMWPKSRTKPRKKKNGVPDFP